MRECCAIFILVNNSFVALLTHVAYLWSWNVIKEKQFCFFYSRSTIDDMGFEAELIVDDKAMVTIGIEGMTCMSCVKNIQGTIGKKAGVISIKVSSCLSCHWRKIKYFISCNSLKISYCWSLTSLSSSPLLIFPIL